MTYIRSLINIYRSMSWRDIVLYSTIGALSGLCLGQVVNYLLSLVGL
jgi:hypothetical protein